MSLYLENARVTLKLEGCAADLYPMRLIAEKLLPTGLRTLCQEKTAWVVRLVSHLAETHRRMRRPATQLTANALWTASTKWTPSLAVTFLSSLMLVAVLDIVVQDVVKQDSMTRKVFICNQKSSAGNPSQFQSEQ